MSTTHSTPRDTPAQPAPERAAGGTAPHQPVERAPLKNLTVRELLGQLTLVEDELRATPFWISPEGNRRVNPEVAQLLARQRAVAEQLRARRVSWASAEGGRHQSAAWPRPPWV